MLTLYDYPPSQNGWKVRLALTQLDTPYESRHVSIFAGDGQTDDFLALNPMGAVPVLQLADGRSLPESNAILSFLASGTHLMPRDPFSVAQVHRWLSFERSYISPSIATLRYWTQTGKLGRQPPGVVEGRSALGRKVLSVLDGQLRRTPFLVGDAYSIADIAVFAYTHLASESGLTLESLEGVRSWILRVREQHGFGPRVVPYAADPLSSGDLP